MWIESMGTRVFYEISGENGPRVALLHGWGCDSSLMKSLREALSADHQVLVIDFPGHGQSGRPPQPWGVPEYAGCLRGVLEELRFVPCALVGHSFGCRVAAWAASEWPEMFTKLVFTGAAGLKKPPTEEGRRRSEEYQRKKRLWQRVEKIPGLHAVGGKWQEKLRKQYGSADYNALDEEMRKTFVRVIEQDLRDCYPKIRQSTLLIWGDADTETPLWMGREMEKVIPDAGLVILEGGSHFAYLEQANRFNTVVRFFLKEEPGT